MKVLTFDIEIKNCIQGKDEERDPRYQYCGGWKDPDGMGISVLCAYASWLEEYRYFDENNLVDFVSLVAEADVITGFNIFGFDVPLLKATLTRLGHSEKTGMAGKCYDPFGDIKQTIGNFPKGWSLDNIAQATFGMAKTEDGANAPRFWQDGKIAQLYNYVTQDVKLEAMLFQHVLDGIPISCGDGSAPITLTGIKKWQDFAIVEAHE